jgi:uncharacterized membrane protein YbhN (UPF0104 family)
MRSLITLALLALVVTVVLLQSNPADILLAAHEISWSVVATALIALLLNGVAAAYRLKIIARDLGSEISFREAMAAVSAGSMAGAAFFQLAGQLMARGALMARNGIGFSSVVVITLYERAVAAILSFMLALAGAYFIFGRVYLDPAAGGAELIKIIIGLFAATAASAFYGYRKIVVSALPQLSTSAALSFIHAVVLSLIVQAPMIVAYVLVSHAFAPHIDLYSLFAATVIVMFASSIPISLAGWGVREVSAVFVLGTVGLASSKALVAAIIIGLGSFLAMAVLALVSVPWRGTAPKQAANETRTIDFNVLLHWAIPLAVATLVLFQVYVPISSGTLLNVNLADPAAILGGCLFLIAAIQDRKMPRWRLAYLNRYVVAATLVLTVALLIGIARFGVTEWAWVNRYLGWFVLLAYGCTGALLVRQASTSGLTAILKAYAAATAAVIALDLLIVVIGAFNSSPAQPFGIMAFSQNRNFLAFQVLMAVAALLASETKQIFRIALLSIYLTGLWFAASRSGWISIAAVLAVALYLRSIRCREITICVCFAAVVYLAMQIQIIFTTSASTIASTPQLIPTEANIHERMLSIYGGLQLFLDHPIFGSGLGAFRNLGHLATSKLPLLIHSSYVWLLAETGIVGFCIFVGFALHLLTVEFRNREKDGARIVIILCLTAFAVMSLPADMIYQRTFWFLIGAALAHLPPTFSGVRK